MVGGRVVETIILDDKVWINTTDGRDECAIYVEKTPEARTASRGDKLWWQGGVAFWTPTDSDDLKGEDITGPVEVELKRIGYSGVPRPKQDDRPKEAWGAGEVIKQQGRGYRGATDYG